MITRFNRLGHSSLALIVMMTATAFTTAPKAGSTQTITVTNKCSFSVDRIYISEVDDANWGNDVLDEDEILAPGESGDIIIECGTWDVKLIAEDGSSCEVKGVEMCSADIWEVTADCGQE